MQFVFAKDNDGAYGLLYCDGNKAEAGKICAALDINQFTSETFGFLTFGQNGSNALFFKVGEDTAASPGSNYIHGICHDVSLFDSDKYNDYLLASFITQSELDALRSGDESVLSEPKADGILNAGSDSFEYGEGALQAILTKLYSGGKVLISVSDSEYNGDCARRIAASLFRYIPPSVRKVCTYTTGTSATPNTRLRIASESDAADSGESWISASYGARENAQSEIGITVGKILAMPENERRAFFTSFETIMCGDGSGYHPNKLIDYIHAYSGNAVIIERVIDTYLRSCADPSVTSIPASIISPLADKYAYYSIRDKILFAVNSVDDVIEPKLVLDDSDALFKKLYLFCDEAQKYIADIFKKSIAELAFSDAELSIIHEAIERFDPTIKNESNARYQECFYHAVGDVYGWLRERVNIYIKVRDGAFSSVESYFSEHSARFMTPRTLADIRNKLEQQCLSKPIEDRDALTDAVINEFERAAAVYYQNAPMVFGTTIDGINVDKNAEADFNTLKDSITGGDLHGVPELLLSVNTQFASYPHPVDAQAARYAALEKGTILYGHNSVFIEFMKTPGRILSIASRAVNLDPVAAVYLVAAYSAPGSYLSDVADFIRANGQHFEAVETLKIEECAQNLSAALRARAETISADEDPFKTYSENANTAVESGNTAILLKAVSEVASDSNLRKNKSSFDVVPLVCAIVLLSAIIIAIIILFVSGVFGFGGNKGGSGDSRGPETSDQTSDSVTDPLTSDSDSETIPADSGSDVTTDPLVTEPPVTEPPVTDPPVTTSPVTEPPVTEPSVTEPPVTEPPVTEPPVTEPPVTEPPVTEPPVTEPPVTEPPVTEPPVTDTPVTEPPVTDIGGEGDNGAE